MPCWPISPLCSSCPPPSSACSFWVTGHRAFDDTAFYCLGGGLLTLPPTVATGLFTHWLNYPGEADRTVRLEKALSYAVMVIAVDHLCLALA